MEMDGPAGEASLEVAPRGNPGGKDFGFPVIRGPHREQDGIFCRNRPISPGSRPVQFGVRTCRLPKPRARWPLLAKGVPAEQGVWLSSLEAAACLTGGRRHRGDAHSAPRGPGPCLRTIVRTRLTPRHPTWRGSRRQRRCLGHGSREGLREEVGSRLRRQAGPLLGPLLAAGLLRDHLTAPLGEGGSALWAKPL